MQLVLYLCIDFVDLTWESVYIIYIYENEFSNVYPLMMEFDHLRWSSCSDSNKHSTGFSNIHFFSPAFWGLVILMLSATYLFLFFSPPRVVQLELGSIADTSTCVFCLVQSQSATVCQCNHLSCESAESDQVDCKCKMNSAYVLVCLVWMIEKICFSVCWCCLNQMICFLLFGLIFCNSLVCWSYFAVHLFNRKNITVMLVETGSKRTKGSKECW